MERLPSGGLEKSLHTAWFKNVLSHCSKQQVSNVDCLGSHLRKPTGNTKTSKEIRKRKRCCFIWFRIQKQGINVKERNVGWLKYEIIHRMAGVGNYLKDHLVPTHLPWKGTPSTRPDCPGPHPI